MQYEAKDDKDMAAKNSATGDQVITITLLHLLPHCGGVAC
jgi:hypothetical protein